MSLPEVLLHALESFGLVSAAILGTYVHAPCAARFRLDERSDGWPHRLQSQIARDLVREAHLAHHPLALVVQDDELGRDARMLFYRVLRQELLAGATEAVAKSAQAPQLLVAAHRLALHRVALVGTVVLVLLGQVRHRFAQHVRPILALGA